MKDIIVIIPEDISKDKELEYLRSLLSEEQQEMFDFFIEHGILRLKGD